MFPHANVGRTLAPLVPIPALCAFLAAPPLTRIRFGCARRLLVARPRTLAPAALTRLLMTQAASPGATLADVAAASDLPMTTARRYLARYAGDSQLLRSFQRDTYVAAWNDLYSRAFVRSTEPGVIAGDLRNYAVVLGIAQEKLLLLNGQPTEITANVHAHRVDLGPLAAKLAAIGASLPADIVDVEVG